MSTKRIFQEFIMIAVIIYIEIGSMYIIQWLMPQLGVEISLHNVLYGSLALYVVVLLRQRLGLWKDIRQLKKENKALERSLARSIFTAAHLHQLGESYLDQALTQVNFEFFRINCQTLIEDETEEIKRMQRHIDKSRRELIAFLSSRKLKHQAVQLADPSSSK